MKSILRHSSRRAPAGFTLIELMVAMLLGLLIVGGIVSLLVSGRKNFREDEQVSRMQDELGFAMTQLTADIELAGFWDVLLDPTDIVLAATLPTANDCGPTDPDTTKPALARTWRFGTRTAVDFEDGQLRVAASPKFTCIDDVTNSTDILAIRRLDAAVALTVPDMAADSRTGMEADQIYLKTNGNVAALFSQPAGGVTTTPTASEFSPASPYSYWAYVPSVYYIRNYSSDVGDGIPSLCRKRISPAPSAPFATECIARGIEDLQLEFGVDTNGDSVAEYFAEALPATVATVVAARVTLLARSEKAEPGYTNAKTYQLTPSYARTPSDNFYRRSLTTTVALRNPANLRKLK